jgi:hypothetical protein
VGKTIVINIWREVRKVKKVKLGRGENEASKLLANSKGNFKLR